MTVTRRGRVNGAAHPVPIRVTNAGMSLESGERFACGIWRVFRDREAHREFSVRWSTRSTVRRSTSNPRKRATTCWSRSSARRYRRNRSHAGQPVDRAGRTRRCRCRSGGSARRPSRYLEYPRPRMMWVFRRRGFRADVVTRSCLEKAIIPGEFEQAGYPSCQCRERTR